MKKVVFAAILMMVGLVTGVMTPACLAEGEIQSSICDDPAMDEQLKEAAGCYDSRDGTAATKVVKTVINVVLTVAGIIAVGVIIFGGFLYITSAGDASKAKRARDTLLYGVIGLVIAVLAFAIVSLVSTGVIGQAPQK